MLQALDLESALTSRELCGFSLITSDNPAADYLRQLLGQDRIDTVIKDLQLTSTRMLAGFSEQPADKDGRRAWLDEPDALI